MPRRAEPKTHLDYLAGLYPEYSPAISFLIEHGSLYARAGLITQFHSDKEPGFFLNKNQIGYIQNHTYRRIDPLSKTHLKYLIKFSKKMLICSIHNWMEVKLLNLESYEYLMCLLGKDNLFRIVGIRKDEFSEIKDPYQLPAQAHLTLLARALDSTGTGKSASDALPTPISTGGSSAPRRSKTSKQPPKLELKALVSNLPLMAGDWGVLKKLYPEVQDALKRLAGESTWLTQQQNYWKLPEP